MENLSSLRPVSATAHMSHIASIKSVHFGRSSDTIGTNKPSVSVPVSLAVPIHGDEVVLQ